MEEIKLPKFKTKEELEQFAIGLMSENESFKKSLDFLEERNRRIFLLVSTLWQKIDKETKNSYRNEYLTFLTSWGNWQERYNDDSKLTHKELLSKLHLVEDELTYTRNNTHNIFLKFKKDNPEAYKELQSIAENMSAYDWE